MQLEQLEIWEIEGLLIPLMGTEKERVALLYRAYGDAPFTQNIDTTGAVGHFVTLLVRSLLQQGQLRLGEHALAILLQTLRHSVGVEKYETIDRLCGKLNTPSQPQIPEVQTPTGPQSAYGVFEGGGVRGLALAGALAAAHARQIQFREVAGVSAGAIVAALYAAGKEPKEIATLLQETNFQRFLDPYSEGGSWANYATDSFHIGRYKGDAFHHWMAQELAKAFGKPARYKVTFSDLGRERIPLTIVATDIERCEPVIFNARETPRESVASAVRASMSIPLLFCPHRINDRLCVDGGLVDNSLIAALERQINHDPLPIIRFQLIEKEEDSEPTNLFSVVLAIVRTLRRALKTEQIQSIIPNPLVYPVEIKGLRVGMTDFGIDKGRRTMLYQQGFEAANTVFENNPLPIRGT